MGECVGCSAVVFVGYVLLCGFFRFLGCRGVNPYVEHVYLTVNCIDTIGKLKKKSAVWCAIENLHLTSVF